MRVMHMNMDSNYTSRPQKVGSEETDDQYLANLVLHNDDVNTFDYVMDTLIEVCDHSMTQAEQCATITHYNGKCEVRSGSFKEMKELRYELISRGLKASVDK
ncbi:MAG: ATP-dependent Clp protease adaptor ClpS [Bacteroidales bacterium]|nr:ATP-dependent Clp protease adaptor ClpS [Bacteroidales bacterium]